jgi:glycosyltransferase involved in cell wall biosynthesis
MAMNVLIITQYFWPESFRINELASSLVERDINVTIITGKPNYPEGKIYDGYLPNGFTTEVYCGATIIRVPIYPRGNKSSLKLVANYLSFIVSATWYCMINYKKISADIIFVYAPSPILQAIPAIVLKKLKKIPLVLNVQDLWPESLEATGYIKNIYILNIIRLIVRYIYKYSNLILVSSLPFADYIRKDAPNSKIAYFPNSVDPKFSLNMQPSTPNIPELNNGFSVVFAGNVGAAQAINVIIDAARLLSKIKDINFIIIGSGSKIEFLKKMIDQYKIKNIYLAGRFPIEMMPPILKKASVLLVTLTNHPIFSATVPNKIQAYMAIGKPILASMNGEGCRLVLDANAGLTSPAEDAQGLADAVIQLYHLPTDQLDELGLNGYKYFHNNFDHDKLVSNLVDHLLNTMRTV